MEPTVHLSPKYIDGASYTSGVRAELNRSKVASQMHLEEQRVRFDLEDRSRARGLLEILFQVRSRTGAVLHRSGDTGNLCRRLADRGGGVWCLVKKRRQFLVAAIRGKNRIFSDP